MSQWISVPLAVKRTQDWSVEAGSPFRYMPINTLISVSLRISVD